MKKLSLILIGLSINFAISANIYCPQYIDCQNQKCTAYPSLNPSLRIDPAVFFLPNGRYLLISINSNENKEPCAYQGNNLYVDSNQGIKLLPNLQAHYSHWHRNLDNSYTCSGNPLNCPFYDIDAVTTAQAK